MAICPYCSHLFEFHETIDGQKNPRSGDISFCINCGNVGKFSGRSIVKTDESKLDSATIAHISEMRRAWRGIKESNGKFEEYRDLN